MAERLTGRARRRRIAELRRAIKASGLPLHVFAETVLGRDERTVRRWLAGAAMPRVAQRFVRAYLTRTEAPS